MGYSCTKAANDTLDAIGQMFATDGNPNFLTIRANQFFFERGREREDGAIIGQLFQMWVNPEKQGEYLAQAIGSVHIAPNGTVKRFPKITRKEKQDAETYKGKILVPGVML